MVTSRLPEAFLACPVKCHLLSEGEAPGGTEYPAWAAASEESHRREGVRKPTSQETGRSIAAAGPGLWKHESWRFAVGRTLRAKGWEAESALIQRIPLNADAMVLVQKQDGKQQTYVFSFRGQPAVQPSTKAWYAALERAGIEDFRWNDPPHAWASWHVQNGTPLFALQEQGGGERPEMVRRYARLGADHLAAYAERLCAGRAVAAPSDGTNPAQV